MIIDGKITVEHFLHVDLAEQSHQIQLEEIATQANMEEIMDRIANPRLDDTDIERERWNMEEIAVPIENEPVVDDSINNVEPVDETLPKTPIGNRRGRRASKASTARPTTVCPKYKIITGTTFAVDGFRYGKIDGITHYFLTHFHADHYIGLKKSFDMPLICSSITSRLVLKFIRVDPKYITTLDVGQTITINGVSITALDANHCPGAVMFFFKSEYGTALHVGDFRANVNMESWPEFWHNDIDELYLDTTYFNCQYSLKTQEECIHIVLSEVKKFLDKNNLNKPLIVVGGYLVGKEKVWLDLANEFKLKVWADQNRRMALDAINDPEMMKYLVDDPKAAHLHLIGLGRVNYDDMRQYLTFYADTFTHLCGFRPSGWEKASRPRHQGPISIVGVEYSEHSSYDELKRFVSFLRPKTIISTVPIGKDPNKTPTIPPSWYTGEVKPVRDKEIAQPKISELLSTVKKPNTLLRSVLKREMDASTPIPRPQPRCLALNTPNANEAMRKGLFQHTPLNQSARQRRANLKDVVSKLKVFEAISLDDDDEDERKSQDSDFLS